MGEGISGDSAPSGEHSARKNEQSAAENQGAVPGEPGEDHADRELRAIVEGAAAEAQFREPTAEERGKLARQARQKQEADDKKLAKLREEVRKQAEKLQKAALKEQRRARRKARWGRRLRRTTLGVVVAAVAGVVVFAYTRHYPQSATGGANDTQTVTNGAVPPTTKPLSPLTRSGPPADPFSRTPADKWANGAAGIVIPAARPHGQFSAAKVESAYRTTKKLLVAAALDKQTLLGGAPTTFANLLTQQERGQFVSQLNKIGLDKHGEPLSSRAWIVQFAPGSTKLIGSVIRVHGSMSAGAAKDRNGYPILRVNVDYIVVYAVEPPRAPADWMRVVAQFQGTVDFGAWAQADTPFEPVWDAGPAVAGIRCGMKDGFVHPEYPSGPPDTAVGTGPAVNPYAFGEPGKTDSCQPTTGT